MFRFFFNITWRSLSKRGVFPVINTLGLSIGLAVVLLISLWIFNEWSFDRAFKESKNIYRINSVLTKYMPGQTYYTTNNFVAPVIREAVPDVLTAVRIYSRSYMTRINDNHLEVRIFWADEDFFRLFDTPFLQGSPEIAMSRPNVVAISETMAYKLFGNTSSVGETFLLDREHPMEVVAVYKDFPANSSMYEFEMVAPYPYLYPATRLRQNIDWEDIDFRTFCLLTARADTSLAGAQIRNAVSSFMGEEAFFVPSLQRLADIHLYSPGAATSSSGDIEKVRTLSLLAIIILLVACINYVNLSTARAQKRSKEIGVSKTVGAKRHEIIVRLSLETAIFTFVSFVVAWVLAWVLLPVFNLLLGEQLSFGLALQPMFLCVVLLIWMATTLLAAAYPAIYLSAFPPLMAIRSPFTAKSGHAHVRKILTVGQFSVAVVLIVWTIIIQKQLYYINSKDIGFNPHHLVAIHTSLPAGSDTEALLNDYRAQSTVVMASRSHRLLHNGSRSILKKNDNDKAGTRMMTIVVDHDFAELMQFKLIAGRPLPVRNPADTVTKMIVNRKAADYLGFHPEELIGKRILVNIPPTNVEVCGVVENFNYESLHHPVEAFGIYTGARERPMISLRVRDDNMAEHLKTFEQIFKTHFPNEMFETSFPDMALAKFYEGDRRTNHVAVVFSVLSILVACMGVFGLTAFMAEQRTKEIGIRKVMGATVFDIVRLFTGSYTKLLCISLVIAIPFAWWVGNRYLQNFAYRIEPDWWIFAVAALIIVALTLLTVGTQAFRAARKNPVEAIKSE